MGVADLSRCKEACVNVWRGTVEVHKADVSVFKSLCAQIEETLEGGEDGEDNAFEDAFR